MKHALVFRNLGFPACLTALALIAAPLAQAADAADRAEAGAAQAISSAREAGAVDAAGKAEAGAMQSVPPAHSEIYASVNGQAISTKDYENAFVNTLRQKYYHGQVPEGEMQAAREDVKNKLVQRILLLEEAGRRGIVPNQKDVDETLAGYDSRYAGNPAWAESRERLLPGLTKQLGEQSQLAQLEQAVREVGEATDAEVREYYDSHPELFTEPEKLRLSAILLKIDPASPPSAWQAAREEAGAIYKRLLAGADFLETSRLHSNLGNADTGGDLGYLHRGMLPDVMQERVDSFELGKINEPLDTLDGVAILRLEERLPPKKREFGDVAQRAKELLIRDRQEKAWKGLLDKLVAAADIKIHHQLATGQREGSGN